MNEGEILYEGDILLSSNNKYFAIIQNDGKNLIWLFNDSVDFSLLFSKETL